MIGRKALRGDDGVVGKRNPGLFIGLTAMLAAATRSWSSGSNIAQAAEVIAPIIRSPLGKIQQAASPTLAQPGGEGMGLQLSETGSGRFHLCWCRRPRRFARRQSERCGRPSTYRKRSSGARNSCRRAATRYRRCSFHMIGREGMPMRGGFLLNHNPAVGQKNHGAGIERRLVNETVPSACHSEPPSLRRAALRQDGLSGSALDVAQR